MQKESIFSFLRRKHSEKVIKKKIKTTINKSFYSSFLSKSTIPKISGVIIGVGFVFLFFYLIGGIINTLKNSISINTTATSSSELINTTMNSWIPIAAIMAVGTSIVLAFFTKWD